MIFIKKRLRSNELGKLLQVITKLRSPSGCPWDRVQTHTTLARYLLEEAHEAYDLMERGAPPEELVVELGDVLLQVVLHSQIASENGDFDFATVCKTLRRKMIKRHPHVFGTESHSTPAEVEASWESRKSPDKPGGRLSGIPQTLPALIRAERIQDRASAIGFDWESIDGVIEKLCEEAAELAIAQKSGDTAQIHDELGDLLFSIVNLSRYLNISPERSLHSTIDKFARRFAYIEKKASDAGRMLNSYTLDELEAFWQESKQDE